jgi:hypothetical protein
VSKVAIVKNPHSTLPGAIPIVEDASVPPHHLILRTDTHDLVVNVKTGKMSKQKRVQFEPLPDYGSHMTWAEFCADVAWGGIDDDDGCGELATATERSNVSIYPGRIKFAKIEDSADDDARPPTPPQLFPWATHVHWCGK